MRCCQEQHGVETFGNVGSTWVLTREDVRLFGDTTPHAVTNKYDASVRLANARVVPQLAKKRLSKIINVENRVSRSVPTPVCIVAESVDPTLDEVIIGRKPCLGPVVRGVWRE